MSVHGISSEARPGGVCPPACPLNDGRQTLTRNIVNTDNLLQD
jgi:hypothetical protein